MIDRTMGVSVIAGATALTVMPCGATMADVARCAGVSAATVSHAAVPKGTTS
ncbi:LacI family DNA-binding transcriptional regulator [Streptomyces roseoverticillatus]|uniref:LacI family DNA-binding transcriptional regulator n=1 Tax=Streptomyces roseoverticillatus TaxID=66429 RepID=A0ABV3IMP6_9ACTN